MEERMRTIAQRQADVEFMIMLTDLETDLHHMRRCGDLIPDDWYNLEKTARSARARRR